MENAVRSQVFHDFSASVLLVVSYLILKDSNCVAKSSNLTRNHHEGPPGAFYISVLLGVNLDKFAL